MFKNSLKIKNLFANWRIEIILSSFIVGYIIFFSFLSIRKVYTLQSYYYDLGIMDQVVYNTAQGRFLEMTNQDFGKNMSRLAIHFDPILALLSPFYKIWNGPETLLVLQSIILGLGAWAVFLIAKNILKNKLTALIFALAYLFYFPVQRANVFDFHAVTLATTFLLFMIYFSLVKKYRLMMVFFILSLLTKEHVGLVTFFWGAYLFFIKKTFLNEKGKEYGLLIMGVSLVMVIATVKIIIPYFRQSEHFAVEYFNDFSQPFKIETILYTRRLLFPYLIFLIFAPLEFLIGLPELAMNIMSTNNNMRAIYFHYNSLIVVFVMFGGIVGFSRIKKFKNIFLILFICLNLVSVYYYNPLPFSFLKEPYWWGEYKSQKINFLKKWNKNLDDSEKVMTTPKIAPFFTARQYYFDFLFDPTYGNMGKSENDIIKKIDQYYLADWIIINQEEVSAGLPRKFYKKLITDSNFRKVEEVEGIEVYKKE